MSWNFRIFAYLVSCSHVRLNLGLPSRYAELMFGTEFVHRNIIRVVNKICEEENKIRNFPSRKNRKNPLLEMTTFWQTSNCVETDGRKNYDLIFSTEPFYQGYRQFRPSLLCGAWRVLPSQLFGFKLPRFYLKHIIARGWSLGTLIEYLPAF